MYFKTEFARDVFYAAFSYVLPDELKQEINRIINYKFLCTKHYMILEIIPIDNELVRLEISTERTLKNISRHKENIKNTFALDEWGFSSAKSIIRKCTMEFNGKSYDSTPRADISSDAIRRETLEVLVKYNESIKFINKGEEIKSRNAEFLITFYSPTLKPIVDVRMPVGFLHSFSFGVPEVEVIKSSIFEKYELDGTQFPGQYMRLRWWQDTKSTLEGESNV